MLMLPISVSVTL